MIRYLATFAAVLLACHTAWADISGPARVIDGDSLVVAGERIRLFGIDAPERRQLCWRDGLEWNCGKEAAAALLEKVGNRELDCRERSRDRYGRVVAVCFLDGEDINRWMVREGWALAYREYSRVYVPQEDEAREAKRGIWVSEFAPPWEWRREKQ